MKCALEISPKVYIVVIIKSAQVAASPTSEILPYSAKTTKNNVKVPIDSEMYCFIMYVFAAVRHHNFFQEQIYNVLF